MRQTKHERLQLIINEKRFVVRDHRFLILKSANLYKKRLLFQLIFSTARIIEPVTSERFGFN